MLNSDSESGTTTKEVKILPWGALGQSSAKIEGAAMVKRKNLIKSSKQERKTKP